MAVLDLDAGAAARCLPGLRAPKYAALAAQADWSQGDEAGAENLARLARELPAEELTPLLVGLLKKEIGEILRLPPERLDETRSLYDQGMDSLMGVELMAAVQARCGVDLPVMALCEAPSIARLAEKIVARLKAPAATAPETGLAAQARELAARHAPELARDEVEAIAAELEQRG
jgi:acyl carrier protein